MKSTLHFTVPFSSTVFVLPKSVSSKLPLQETTVVEGIINHFPFRTTLELNKGSLELNINKPMRKAVNTDSEDVAIEITRVGDEPETRVPHDLQSALTADPKAFTMWTNITAMARREWILWIITGKLEETRSQRIKKGCDMLRSGKKRVCCFGGLSWMTKENTKPSETWVKLPKNV